MGAGAKSKEFVGWRLFGCFASNSGKILKPRTIAGRLQEDMRHEGKSDWIDHGHSCPFCHCACLTRRADIGAAASGRPSLHRGPTRLAPVTGRALSGSAPGADPDGVDLSPVVEAARWVEDPTNARLKGDQLSAALQDKDWDPSVKSLVPFPEILRMMDDRLDWMQKLGDGFLAQQNEVMDSVQRLRRKAEEAGTLQSSPQQTVTTQDQTITVEPANPNVVYVPVYDPTVVYGAWPYPDYPPYYFPPSGFVFGPPVWPGFWWGPVIDIGFVAPYWRWHHFDWDHHRIRIDRDRFYRIEGHH